MANMIVPASSQRMFSTVDVVLMNHALGRDPFQGFEPTIYPGQYTLSGAQAAPARVGGGYQGPRLPAVEAPVVEAAPKSSAAARAIWPSLR